MVVTAAFLDWATLAVASILVTELQRSCVEPDKSGQTCRDGRFTPDRQHENGAPCEAYCTIQLASS